MYIYINRLYLHTHTHTHTHTYSSTHTHILEHTCIKYTVVIIINNTNFTYSMFNNR